MSIIVKGVPLQREYDDCPRLGSSVYFTRWVSFYVSSHLRILQQQEGVFTISDIMRLFSHMLRGWLGSCFDAEGINDVACCMITPGTRFTSRSVGHTMLQITPNHRRLISVLAPFFEVEYREVKGVGVHSRCFDLRGRRCDLMGFVPMYDFISRAYELGFFLHQLIELRHLSRREKFAERVVWTDEFVRSMQEELLYLLNIFKDER